MNTTSKEREAFESKHKELYGDGFLQTNEGGYTCADTAVAAAWFGYGFQAALSQPAQSAPDVVERDGFKGIVCNETNIDFVGYDPERELLRVEYTSGKRYNYLDVPKHYWSALGYAKSKGAFLATEIKGNFRYYCVNGD